MRSPFVVLFLSRDRLAVARSTDARIGFLCPAGVPAAVRSLALTDVLSRVEADAGKALEILKEYVRFPTISAHKRAQPETAEPDVLLQKDRKSVV